MKILAIETSCDETSAAVVEKLENGELKILSNIVASSQDMHAKTGGVIPENAAREQIKSIIPVIEESLTTSSLVPSDLDALAVTVGPGLIGSLLVGVETAKTLSYLWNKPLIPVNHLLGHIFANFFTSPKSNEGGLPMFPLLALIVSGGHTDLVYLKSPKEIKYVGGTRDDAAGEAFDKCARLLGLPYPGGPSIAKEAEKFLIKNPNAKLNLFPRPMLSHTKSPLWGVTDNDFDFSFSGLKTAVAREVASQQINQSTISRLAAEVQEAIVDCLVAKSLKAIQKYNPKSFLLGGGVAANQRLREKLQNTVEPHAEMVHRTVHHSGNVTRAFIHVPEAKLCTDNAAAIAAAALVNYKPVNWQTVSPNPELTITSKF